MPRLLSRAQVTQPLASPAQLRAPIGTTSTSSRNPTRKSNGGSGSAGIHYQPPTHLPLHAMQLRALNSLVASYGSENSLMRRCIADALRVLGDAAGDLAELVPAVDFTGEGKDEDDEEGEGVKKEMKYEDGEEELNGIEKRMKNEEGEEEGEGVEKRLKNEEEEEDGKARERLEVTKGGGASKSGGTNKDGGKEGKRLLVEMEEKARQMVDRAWETATAGQVVRGEVAAHAQSEGIARESWNGSKVNGLWEVYDVAIEELKKQRSMKPMKVRYGGVAEYQEFRRSVWETQHSGDPMPPTKHWFPHDPLSQNHRTHSGGGTMQQQQTSSSSRSTPEPESDSDIEIESARQSYNCPITLRPFSSPVTSSLCPHSFEETAIVPMITASTTYRDAGNDDRPPVVRDHPPLSAAQLSQRESRGEFERCIHCPAAGCDKWISTRHLREDRVLLRRIRVEKERRERAEVLRGLDAEDNSFVQVGDDSIISPSEKARAPPQRSGVRRLVLDDDSDEDA